MHVDFFIRTAGRAEIEPAKRLFFRWSEFSTGTRSVLNEVGLLLPFFVAGDFNAGLFMENADR